MCSNWKAKVLIGNTYSCPVRRYQLIDCYNRWHGRSTCTIVPRVTREERDRADIRSPYTFSKDRLEGKERKTTEMELACLSPHLNKAFLPGTAEAPKQIYSPHLACLHIALARQNKSSLT